MKDKILAGQCLRYKGCDCDNKDCKNDTCPLHKSIPYNTLDIKSENMDEKEINEELSRLFRNVYNSGFESGLRAKEFIDKHKKA